MRILDNFRLQKEKEDYKAVVASIDKGVVFKGTNLWVLVFAIFICSLGLNVNSTAVVIGAMLISPLMGPIMGLGLGMAINDLVLLRKSMYNYVFAGGVGLAASTLYFSISPLNDAHSEILARTSPNIYDVLIAVFGGFAGILATSSKMKGNVIPGVAIATALMPPLCTAGYGLATLQLTFFLGAFYLFIINSVFISLATLITTRVLKFPYKHLPLERDEQRARHIVWGVVLITLLPSIYFGYDIVQQNKFQQRANQFIEREAVFPNDYLLKKTINPKAKTITLVYGGQKIEQREISLLKQKLPWYEIDTGALEVRQGFSYFTENDQTTNLNQALSEREAQLMWMQFQLDSLRSLDTLSLQVFNELKTQNSSIHSFLLRKLPLYSDAGTREVWVCHIAAEEPIDEAERKKIEEWLKVRLRSEAIELRFETSKAPVPDKPVPEKEE